MAGIALIYIELFVGAFAFVGLIATYIFFGSLIWLQTRIWLLARRGFAQIRHVREDKVEKYYYMRVRDEHYSFNDGVYIANKDAFTKTAGALNKFDYKLLDAKRNKNEALSAEEAEIMKWLDSIKNSKVMDISTLSWGIPTITYYGNDPNPHNFSDRKKLYDAKNIAAMIKRILMTKEWKLVRMVLLLCGLSIIAWFALSVLTYNAEVSNGQNLKNCLVQLNDSNVRWINLINQTQTQLNNLALATNQSNIVHIG